MAVSALKQWIDICLSMVSYHVGAPERIIDRCSTFLNAEGNVRLPRQYMCLSV